MGRIVSSIIERDTVWIVCAWTMALASVAS
jgi:hypothetical protein